MDPVDQAMVRSINQIAHSLGMETIAEFVESDTILEKLGLFGVDYVQGYAIGRPGPQI
jgi:EAL domain-containing protein (putative c-di-GMP-specific phosphodiesterase class I)